MIFFFFYYFHVVFGILTAPKRPVEYFLSWKDFIVCVVCYKVWAAFIDVDYKGIAYAHRVDQTLPQHFKCISFCLLSYRTRNHLFMEILHGGFVSEENVAVAIHIKHKTIASFLLRYFNLFVKSPYRYSLKR